MEQQSLLDEHPARQEEPDLVGSITITGSRTIPRVEAFQAFESHLGALLGVGNTWLIGGALGLDQWALEWLLERGESCVAVVPFTGPQQPRAVQDVLGRVGRLVELRLPNRKSSYLERNRYMVDRSRLVVGFCAAGSRGTLHTIDYAIKSMKEVRFVPMAGESASC